MLFSNFCCLLDMHWIKYMYSLTHGLFSFWNMNFMNFPQQTPMTRSGLPRVNLMCWVLMFCMCQLNLCLIQQKGLRLPLEPNSKRCIFGPNECTNWDISTIRRKISGNVRAIWFILHLQCNLLSMKITSGKMIVSANWYERKACITFWEDKCYYLIGVSKNNFLQIIYHCPSFILTSHCMFAHPCRHVHILILCLDCIFSSLVCITVNGCWVSVWLFQDFFEIITSNKYIQSVANQMQKCTVIIWDL